MALELKYSVGENQDRLGFTFMELTGLYSPANLGGYESPNPSVGDVTDARLEINLRGDTNIYVVPITATSDIEYETLVPATSFGFAAGEKITDGIYQIRYVVDYIAPGGALGTAFDTFHFAFVNGLQCCITSIRANLTPPKQGCDCADDQGVSAADQLLIALCKQVTCDKLDRAQENIDYLKRYCACHCTTCN